MKQARRARAALTVLSLLSWAALLTGAASAQTKPPPTPTVLPPGANPLIVRVPAEQPSSKRPLMRLSGEQMAHLREAQNFRASGLHERAKSVLRDLDKAVPHHAI